MMTYTFVWVDADFVLFLPSSGLGNLYYWIDPKEGLLGLIMTSVLPFMDKEVLYLYDAMEKAAYGNLQEIGKSKDGGKGSNYQIP